MSICYRIAEPKSVEVAEGETAVDEEVGEADFVGLQVEGSEVAVPLEGVAEVVRLVHSEVAGEAVQVASGEGGAVAFNHKPKAFERIFKVFATVPSLAKMHQFRSPAELVFSCTASSTWRY